MEHYEFLFLLHRAHLLRKYIAQAEKDGEEFHVSNSFSPLKSGLEAQAIIRKINLSDESPVLILRLRYRTKLKDGANLAAKAAHAFFEKDYTALPKPIDEGPWREHVYYSSDVPKPVTIPTDAPPDSSPDAAAAAPPSAAEPKTDRT
jgi:hypothetical protein